MYGETKNAFLELRKILINPPRLLLRYHTQKLTQKGCRYKQTHSKQAQTREIQWPVDLPVLSPLLLRCPAHFQLPRVSCAVMQSHWYFYRFLRIARWFYSSIRLTPAHSSSTTAEVPQSSCQIRVCWWVLLLLSLARAHSSPRLTPSLFAW